MSNENSITKVRFGQAGEHRLVVGEKPIYVRDREIRNATLKGIVEYVRSNAEALKSQASAAYFLVDVGNACIALKMHEGHVVADSQGRHYQGVIVEGAAKLSKDAEFVLGILKQPHNDLHKLAITLRGAPQVFPNMAVYKDVVSKLRNVRIVVNKMAQEISTDTGDRTSAFEQKVANANELEFGWTFEFPLFEGEQRIQVQVSMLYDANASALGVTARVFCPNITDVVRKEQERVVNAAVGAMRTALGKSVAGKPADEGTSAESDPDIIPFVEVSSRPDADEDAAEF